MNLFHVYAVDLQFQKEFTQALTVVHWSRFEPGAWTRYHIGPYHVRSADMPVRNEFQKILKKTVKTKKENVWYQT